jgi:GH18 family chitinase
MKKPTRKGRFAAPTCSARQALAAEIAAALFTDGTGKRAKRLIMEIGGWRDCGGWSEAGAAQQIERVLAQLPNAIALTDRPDESRKKTTR